MDELALTSIGSVTLKTDFEVGARPDDVVADVAQMAALQAPERYERGWPANWKTPFLKPGAIVWG